MPRVETQGLSSPAKPGKLQVWEEEMPQTPARGISLAMSRVTISADLERRIARRFDQEFGDDFISHQPLKDYCRFPVGGVADFVVVAHSPDQIIKAATLAVESGLPYMILGGCTGSLISDAGLAGLAIINRTDTIAFQSEQSQVIAQSGVTTAALVNKSATRNIGGLEFLSTVPGTIGGAIITNATVGESSIGSFVKELSVLTFVDDRPTVVQLSGGSIEFKPSWSSLLGSSSSHPPIILTAKLQCASLQQEEILKRLSRFHHSISPTQLERPQLANIFTRPITLSELPKDALSQIKKLPVTISRLGQSFSLLPSGLVTATDTRLAVDRLNQSISHHLGQNLELRLQFLGYWPKTDE